MNTQKIEKVSGIGQVDGSVELVGAPWITVQGEGPYAGMPAVFVRLAGCNLQCPWCDTDYTSERSWKSPADIIDSIAVLTNYPKCYRDPRKLVVITGGEPFRQNLSKLLFELVGAGFTVQIETNGTIFPDWPCPWDKIDVVCSPKTSLHRMLQPYLCALKYVVEAGCVSNIDGLPVSTLGQKVGVARPSSAFRGQIYIQPLDVGNPELNKVNLAAAVSSCLVFGYRLCIQVSKVAGLK